MFALWYHFSRVFYGVPVMFAHPCSPILRPGRSHDDLGGGLLHPEDGINESHGCLGCCGRDRQVR